MGAGEHEVGSRQVEPHRAVPDLSGRGFRGLGSVLRYPPIHFALIGAALFLLSNALSPDGGELRSLARQPIVISAERVRALRSELERTRGIPADAETLRQRIEIEVDEEILYREARALSLDFGDQSVRRRLLQKMQALNDDLSRGEDELLREARNLGLDNDKVIRPLLIEKMRIVLRDAPRREAISELELRAALEQHREQFELPERRSLTQVFLAGDPATLATQAASLGRDLSSLSPADPALRSLGDSLPVSPRLHNYSHSRLESRFGKAFADALFVLDPGHWSQPIESPYGVHFVWIEEIYPAELPQLGDVRKALALKLVKERESARLHSALAALRTLYDIRIEADYQAIANESQGAREQVPTT
jgi:hypothetical protein